MTRSMRTSSMKGLLREDTRGVAAVEFALVLPAMVALFFGVLETTRAIRAAQKVDLVAHTIADLAAQKLTGGDGAGQAALTDADFDDIFSAARMMIWPLPKDFLHMEIDQIDSHDADNVVNPGPPRVDWVVTDNADPHRVCQFLTPSDTNDFGTIPTSLQTSGFIISARVEYNYGAAVLPRFFARALTLTRWSYKFPRSYMPGKELNDMQLKATGAKVRAICSYESPIATTPTPPPTTPSFDVMTAQQVRALGSDWMDLSYEVGEQWYFAGRQPSTNRNYRSYDGGMTYRLQN
jgi:TadE-like protein